MPREREYGLRPVRDPEPAGRHAAPAVRRRRVRRSSVRASVLSEGIYLGTNIKILEMIALKVPPLGESIVEATVSRWVKQQGDAVNAGDTVLELDTDKI